MTHALRPEYRARLETEAQYSARIVQWARLNGWLAYHTFYSGRSQQGFPDLTLVKQGRLVFIEVKSESGRLSASQQQWLALLDSVPGIDAVVARPSNWDMIASLLKRDT